MGFMTKTTITLETTTKDKLDEYGKKNDSYDDIILKLMEKIENE